MRYKLRIMYLFALSGGIQVPLYKGKITSTLDVNNYRGIILLNTFNKLFYGMPLMHLFTISL